MTTKTDWFELLGKRVILYLSKESIYPVTVVVSSAKNGTVTFDGVSVQYNEDDLRFVSLLEKKTD